MGSIKFLADEDFSHRAIRGVRGLLYNIDLVTVQEVGLRSASDREVLAFAAESDRILLSHDENTMLSAAARRISAGQKMPGLFLAPQQTAIGRLVAAVVLVAECSDPNEWRDRIEYLPI